ncbi:hypothetical protein KCJ24_001395 [Campylobacter jejuni]|nr:hypothetical protein [Campylobacter jejuni]
MNSNYPNTKRLESILNKTSFHQIYDLWINKKISHYALKILERWAENYPNTIKTLGMSDLMTLVLPQEKMEIEILSSANSKKQIENGLTTVEILQEAEIDLNYYIKTNPQLYSPLFQETMQQDKVQKLEESINDDYWKLQTQIMDLQHDITKQE